MRQRVAETESVPALRRSTLTVVGRRLVDRIARGNGASMMFVCTHNARRSELAQVWATIAAHHFRVENLRAFSGGSSPTAVHPRILAALSQAGLDVRASTSEGRSVHEVRFAPQADTIRLYSKRYDAAEQPQTGFVAIVKCPSADEGCPVIPGSSHRLAVLYADPGAADGTPDEARAYVERCVEISRDMLFLFSFVRLELDAREVTPTHAAGR